MLSNVFADTDTTLDAARAVLARRAPGWTVRWMSAAEQEAEVGTLGWWCWSDSRIVVRPGPAAEVLTTVVHELAHALAYQRAQSTDHGPAFERALRELARAEGLDPGACL